MADHGRHEASLLLLFTLALAAPGETRSQESSPDFEWQFSVYAVSWDEVDRLQERVREYNEEGAIGAYEVLVRKNGSRFNAFVVAEVTDPVRFARLLGWKPSQLPPRQGPPGFTDRAPDRDGADRPIHTLPDRARESS